MALLLGFALLLMLLWGGYQHDRQWDWTANQRHTLSPQSLAAVKALGAVQATLFVEEGGDPDGILRRLLERYRLHNPQLTLHLLDPDLNPAAAEPYGVKGVGVLVLRHGERWEKVEQPDESGITNALLRLAKPQRKQIGFLVGHGEHALAGAGRMAYGQWAKQLRDEGYGVREVALHQQPQVPDDLDLLVVAGPQSALFEGELQHLKAWFEDGGKLLLMLDPGQDDGLQALLTPYGIRWLPGMVIDVGAQVLGANPTTPLITQFPKEHDIFRGMDQVPFLVTAGGLELVRTAGPWHREKLLAGAEQGWLEQDNHVQRRGGRVAFDAETDIKGPITMGVAVQEGAQRLVVVTDSDFAADGFSRYGANLDLAMGMVRWLVQDEALIALKPKPMVDAGLMMDEAQVQGLFVLFVLLLPLLLLLVGGRIWWLRRHL